MSIIGSLCGIECKFSKLSDLWNFLDFSEIDFSSYYFSVVDSSIFSKGTKIDIPAEFVPNYFQTLVQQSFVTERLVLHLYPEAVSPEKIDNYTDFLKSHCEMIVLICDCYFVEIYCKNHSWLQTLLNKAKKISGTIVDEKYENADPRTTMYV